VFREGITVRVGLDDGRVHKALGEVRLSSKDRSVKGRASTLKPIAETDRRKVEML
jgi:hypothetical protein